MGSLDSWAEARLAELRARNLERKILPRPGIGGVYESDGRRILNLASNDYLDLARDPTVVEAARRAITKHGAGATASRLVAGSSPAHHELEAQLAQRKGREAALLFGSGFLANLGVLNALTSPGDVILADRLVHASIVDGIRQSGCRFHRFRHNDMEHLERLLAATGETTRTWIVTESVFSMDGDVAPLEPIGVLAARHGAHIIVDEAHALGIFGVAGHGLAAAPPTPGAPEIVVGTLSKALGGYGGFVACSTVVRQLLVNRARAQIYTTALPPASVAAASAALQTLAVRPKAGEMLLARADGLRRRLRAAGLDTGSSASQIIPVILGREDTALAVAAELESMGILAPAIRPPTVPAGTARLRLSVTLAHTEEDLTHVANAIIDAARRAK